MVEISSYELFILVLAASAAGSVLGKVLELAIDALVWLREVVADIAAAVACKRGAKRKKSR